MVLEDFSSLKPWYHSDIFHINRTIHYYIYAFSLSHHQIMTKILSNSFHYANLLAFMLSLSREEQLMGKMSDVASTTCFGAAVATHHDAANVVTKNTKENRDAPDYLERLACRPFRYHRLFASSRINKN